METGFAAAASQPVPATLTPSAIVLVVTIDPALG